MPIDYGSRCLALQTEVLINMITLSRDGKVFKNPNQFNPDRWDKNVSDSLHPFSFLPFGFGPRSCYGRAVHKVITQTTKTRYTLCTYAL